MTAAVLTWYQGTTRKITTTIVDTNGDNVDLTGATAKFALAPILSGDDPVYKLTGDGVVLDQPSAAATVTVDPGDTAMLTPGDYCMQLEVTLQNGTVVMAYDVVVQLKENKARLAT